jgi:hypothetical protein
VIEARSWKERLPSGLTLPVTTIPFDRFTIVTAAFSSNESSGAETVTSPFPSGKVTVSASGFSSGIESSSVRNVDVNGRSGFPLVSRIEDVAVSVQLVMDSRFASGRNDADRFPEPITMRPGTGAVLERESDETVGPPQLQ